MNAQMIAEKLNILLDLDHPPVGVRFLYSKEEFDRCEGILPKKPLMYCRAVRAACSGHRIRLSREKGGCRGSNRALGLTEPDDSYWTGESGCGLGLYKDKETAACVAGENPILPPVTYGLLIQPLSFFTCDPDVVILVANSRETMRILQGYTYEYGLCHGFNMSGNQAVCVEATVTPALRQELNVSMLCSGTRHHARWKTDQIMTGVPAAKAEGLVSGLIGTVNAIEYDGRKTEIEDAFRANGYEDIGVIYGKTYFK